MPASKNFSSPTLPSPFSLFLLDMFDSSVSQCCEEHLKSHPLTNWTTHRSACRHVNVRPRFTSSSPSQPSVDNKIPHRSAPIASTRRNLAHLLSCFSRRFRPGRSITRKPLNILLSFSTSFYCVNSPIHIQFLHLVKGNHALILAQSFPSDLALLLPPYTQCLRQ